MVTRRSAGDMSVYFQMLDSLLASERLPPEYAGRMQQVRAARCPPSYACVLVIPSCPPSASALSLSLLCPAGRHAAHVAALPALPLLCLTRAGVQPFLYPLSRAQVLCNDCGKQGFARFHFAYHSCPHCRSYNTRLL